jgi:transmembrane sensor
MSKERFDYLYSKLLSDTNTADELKEFTFLLVEYADVSLLKDVDAVGDVVSNLSEQQSADIWTNIERNTKISKPIGTYYKRVGLVAASVVLFAFISALVWYSNSATEEWIVNTESAINQHKLQDGTIVYLKPGSKILTLSDFSVERNVKIVGEVFLDVAHDNARPFKVKLPNDIELQVLGTRFNVKTYNSFSDVVLTEGKLAVSNSNHEEIVQPSERVLVSNVEIRKSKVDTLHHNSWIDQQLYFNNKNLEYVIKELNIYYPTKKFELNSAYAEKLFTGYLPTNDYAVCKAILTETYNHKQLLID